MSVKKTVIESLNFVTLGTGGVFRENLAKIRFNIQCTLNDKNNFKWEIARNSLIKRVDALDTTSHIVYLKAHLKQRILPNF